MANFAGKNNVTLLHKGVGPTLFQYKSRPIPVNELGSSRNSPKCSPRGGCEKPPRRIFVKCLDRQDENTMFTKRLQARDKSAARRPASAASTSVSKKRLRDSSDPFIREKMFSVPQRKVDAFPPPTFLPRWNPRHKDRTYMEKVILDDPWSLPKEKRIELQKKTGLRLKSMSRHYQFKVGMNLPSGKDALDKKCLCYVDYCDHCTKSHTYRCPLHIQLLDSIQPDCKTELGEFCPFRKNPEDLPLSKIKDPAIYVSEVVRRLKAGEIQDAPPFPSRLLLDEKERDLQKTLKQAATETTSAVDLMKKTPTESSFAQTEPFLVDVDMSNGIKDNVCQTMKPPSDEPLLTTGLKPMGPDLPYASVGHYTETSTQVSPFMIVPFEKISGKFSRRLVNTIMNQSLSEVNDEAVLHDIQTHVAVQAQELSNIQRKQHFRLMREQFRNEAYGQEEVAILQESMNEVTGESNLGAVLFSQSFFRGFAGKALDSLRDQGVLINEDLIGIQAVFQDSVNVGVANKLEVRANSRKLLDEITWHALNDLEIDYFLRNVVDAKYLQPQDHTSRQLMDMIRMRDDNMQTIEKIKKILLLQGWKLNDQGVLYNYRDEASPASTSESEDTLDAFLKKVRVSLDSEGNPKYLVDSQGRALPINVVWLPYLTNTMTKKDESTGENVWDSTKTFDIVLSEESFSTTTDGDLEAVIVSASDVSSGKKKTSSKTTDSLKEGEIEVGFDDEGDEGSDEEDKGKMIFRVSQFKDVEDEDEYADT